MENRKDKINNLLNILSGRVTVYGAAIVIKLLLLVAIIVMLQTNVEWIYKGSMLLSALVVLWMLNNRENPSYKIAWILPTMAFPLFGGLFYLFFGVKRLSKRQMKKLSDIRVKTDNAINDNEHVQEKLRIDSRNAYIQSKYITDNAKSPPFENTQVEYFALGEDMFESLKKELRKAKHHIFMEFFIIKEGKMWEEIYEILVRKVAEGVDVRVMWDDFGSILHLRRDFEKRLDDAGIKWAIYNPLKPVLNLRLNNRSHRKIVVIDGHTGYVGGINIGDEYINEEAPFGHWKDTAVKLYGEAVWSLSVMFLTSWDYIKEESSDYDSYKPEQYVDYFPKSDGIVQPFSDHPMDNEAVGESVYLNLINRAERYVYITTPYLIVDNEMITALTMAAKSGVDVRIITPHVGDKAYVHAVTRSYYDILIESGVKIYEYTPGFIHAKSFVVDDKYAVVGTINLDYRSLYLHVECAAWMYRCKAIGDIKKDFEDTLKVSQRMGLHHSKKLSGLQKFARAVLRAFAPLM